MNDLFFHNLGRIYPLVPLTLPNGEFHSSSLINALQNGGDQIANGKSFSNQGKVVIEPIKDWKGNSRKYIIHSPMDGYRPLE